MAGLPGFEGAVKEFQLKQRRQAEMDGEQMGKKRVPWMILAVLVVFENVVDEAKTLFGRAYAWYRLFRHCASLRYHDAAGCSLSGLRLRTRG